MSDLGIGAMLNRLGGYSSQNPSDYYGRVIMRAEMGRRGGESSSVDIVFEDGSAIYLYDTARSCCESRWMETDDDLSELSGEELTGIDIRTVPDKDGADGVLECQFLLIHTNRSTATIKSYNEHNGYYGGIDLAVSEFNPED
jgi:hypothetical protein